MASIEPLISSAVNAGLSAALEGLESGAADAGLPRDSARIFVKQALAGTVLLLGDIEESPATLKDRVASPAGTTIAGLVALEDRGARGAMMRVVERAVQDGEEGRQK